MYYTVTQLFTVHNCIMMRCTIHHSILVLFAYHAMDCGTPIPVRPLQRYINIYCSGGTLSERFGIGTSPPPPPPPTPQINRKRFLWDVKHHHETRVPVYERAHLRGEPFAKRSSLHGCSTIDGMDRSSNRCRHTSFTQTFRCQSQYYTNSYLSDGQFPCLFSNSASFVLS